MGEEGNGIGGGGLGDDCAGGEGEGGGHGEVCGGIGDVFEGLDDGGWAEGGGIGKDGGV